MGGLGGGFQEIGQISAGKGGASGGVGAGGGCPPGQHMESVPNPHADKPGQPPYKRACVPDKKVGGGGGGGGGGKISLPGGGGGQTKVKEPPKPKPVPIDPQAKEDPRLTEFAEGYTQHGEDLESGTGYAMDVLRGQQQDSMEAELDRMRSAAANAGIPFDETQARAELQRGINASMAQEKLGREKMMTDWYQGGVDVMRSPMDERFTRLRLDLERDIAEAGQNVDIHKLLYDKYGIDVNAASAYDRALLALYGGLYQKMIPDWGDIMGSLNMGSVNIGGSYG
jgi:hypothetical protein